MSSETTDKSSSATARQTELSGYELEALKHAEEIGVLEWKVNGNIMEYWSFFGQGEGWYFVRHDLDKKKDVFRGANIPWDSSLPQPIPAFLMTERGATLYNYMQG